MMPSLQGRLLLLLLLLVVANSVCLIAVQVLYSLPRCQVRSTSKRPLVLLAGGRDAAFIRVSCLAPSWDGGVRRRGWELGLGVLGEVAGLGKGHG